LIQLWDMVVNDIVCCSGWLAHNFYIPTEKRSSARKSMASALKMANYECMDIHVYIYVLKVECTEDLNDYIHMKD